MRKSVLLFVINILFITYCSAQCNPLIPPNVTVINTSRNVGQGSWFFWVCSPDSVNAGGGSNSFYLESGAYYTGGSGTNIIWVPPGAHVNVAGGGSNTIYYVCPESIIHAGSGAKLIQCPAIHYDYTYAPANGCAHTTDTASCPIHLVADFVSSDTIFCDESGRCIDFTDQSAGNPTSWQWLFPGATPDTSTLQNPTGICYYIPGSYDVTLIASNGGVSDTLAVSHLIIFGSGAATPALTFSGDTIFCSPEAKYQWYFNGLPVTGATDSFFIAGQLGNYAVFITDFRGCSRLSSGVLASVNGLEVPDLGLEVYPNPAANELWIRSYGLGVTEDLEINNTLGQCVYHSQLKTQNPQPITMIDISSLAKGVYYVCLRDEQISRVARFVKE